MTLQECAHPLEYAVMGGHLVDDELAAQPTIPAECVHPLEHVAMRDHLVDNELAA
jgi:hypothetical protein